MRLTALFEEELQIVRMASFGSRSGHYEADVTSFSDGVQLVEIWHNLWVEYALVKNGRAMRLRRIPIARRYTDVMHARSEAARKANISLDLYNAPLHDEPTPADFEALKIALDEIEDWGKLGPTAEDHRETVGKMRQELNQPLGKMRQELNQPLH